MRGRTLLLALSGIVAAAACSNNGTPTATFSAQVGGAGGMGSSGGAGGTRAAGTATSSSGAVASSSGALASSSSAAASSSSAAASSSTGGSSGAGGGGGSGGGCSYAYSDTCDAAVVIPSVSGDTGSDMRTVTGSTSQWLEVHVTEDSILIVGLSYTVTLEPASGASFDLNIYDGDASAPNCNANPILASGTPESFHDSWPDTINVDDGRWIIFEVRYTGGSGCGADAQWTLTITGNT